VQLSAAFGLALVAPVDRLGALRVERDRDHGALREGLRLEAVDYVGYLCQHARAVVALVAPALWQEPLVVLLLRVVPSPVCEEEGARS